MPKLSIDINEVDSYNQSLTAMLGKIQEARSDISSLRYRLSDNVLGRRNISGQISSILSSLDTLNTNIQSILSTTTNGYVKYRDTEDEIYRIGMQLLGFEAKSSNESLFVDFVNEYNKMDSYFGEKDLSAEELSLLALYYSKFEVGDGKITASGSALAYLVNDMTISFGNYEVSLEKDKVSRSAALFQLVSGEYIYKAFGMEQELGMHSMSLTTYRAKVEEGGYTAYLMKKEEKVEESLSSGYEANDWNDKLEQTRDKYAKPKEWDLYDKTNNGMTSKEAEKKYFSEKEATLYEYKAEASKSYSYKDYENSIEGAYGKGSVEAKFGNAEASAELSAGLYAVSKDGKKYFSPGAGGKVGVSVSAIEVEANGQLGNDMIGVYGKGSASALSASAEAEAGIGMVNGEFELNASASAEAILAEVGVEGGANILGGKVGGSASVNFGIGAKAEFGYSEGVVKCNVGASLGIGVDLSIEVDVGGMVDTVCDAATSVIDGIGDFIGSWF